jgi:anti-sigma factor RsiW
VNCRRFEERLDDFTDGRLSDIELRAAVEHLESCARCRALVEALRDSLAALGPETLCEVPGAGDADLAAAILARTSGGACAGAQMRLADLVDGALPADDVRLVELHLEGCPRCAALRGALTWLAGLLPQMARLEPDVDLAPVVARRIAALGAARRRAPRWAESAATIGGAWRRLLLRPRFAWEAAYVGLLTLVFLCGTPVSPFRGVPQRALAAVQLDPRYALDALVERARALHSGIGALGARAWDASGGRATNRAREMGDDFAGRHPGMHEAWAGLDLHGDELRRQIGARNLAGATVALDALGNDLRAFWRSWRRRQEALPVEAPGEPPAEHLRR